MYVINRDFLAFIFKKVQFDSVWFFCSLKFETKRNHFLKNKNYNQFFRFDILSFFRVILYQFFHLILATHAFHNKSHNYICCAQTFNALSVVVLLENVESHNCIAFKKIFKNNLKQTNTELLDNNFLSTITYNRHAFGPRRY